jgi:hypothetical protein
MTNRNRGLSYADRETRKRVASQGGKSPHDTRGLQAADKETRKRVASQGGKTSRSRVRKSN